MGKEYINIKDMQPVEVARTFLGIKKGTILKFDSASSKYVSMAREEEVGDGEYYYSGYAIAIDPDIIDKNVGYAFKVLPKLNSNKNETEKELVESTLPETGASNEGQESKFEEEEAVAYKVQEKPKTEVERGILDDVKDTHVLKFRCGICGEETSLFGTRNGLFLPASKTFNMKLKCVLCGNTVDLYYDEIS